MNRLRLYLILAILLVGLTPDPDRLFGINEPFNRCRSYSSAFVYIKYWGKNDDCYWGPWPGTVQISVPGFLDSGGQVLPSISTYSAVIGDSRWVWGSVSWPTLWHDKDAQKHWHFELLPKINFEQSDWGHIQ